jgi:hypothetical protein
VVGRLTDKTVIPLEYRNNSLTSVQDIDAGLFNCLELNRKIERAHKRAELVTLQKLTVLGYDVNNAFPKKGSGLDVLF